MADDLSSRSTDELLDDLFGDVLAEHPDLIRGPSDGTGAPLLRIPRMPEDADGAVRVVSNEMVRLLRDVMVPDPGGIDLAEAAALVGGAAGRRTVTVHGRALKPGELTDPDGLLPVVLLAALAYAPGCIGSVDLGPSGDGLVGWEVVRATGSPIALRRAVGHLFALCSVGDRVVLNGPAGLFREWVGRNAPTRLNALTDRPIPRGASRMDWDPAPGLYVSADGAAYDDDGPALRLAAAASLVAAACGGRYAVIGDADVPPSDVGRAEWFLPALAAAALGRRPDLRVRCVLVRDPEALLEWRVADVEGADDRFAMAVGDLFGPDGPEPIDLNRTVLAFTDWLDTYGLA